MAHPNANEPEFLPVKEAVRLFGLSRSRLYREAGAGRVELRKVGLRAVVVSAASVRALITAAPIARIGAQRTA